MTVTYTINHAISPALETWLAGQPDFVSIDIQPNVTNVYYDHASEAEEVAFKELLADQLGLAGENVNVSDADLLRATATLTGQQTFDDEVQFNGPVQFSDQVDSSSDFVFSSGGSITVDPSVTTLIGSDLNMNAEINMVDGSDIVMGDGSHIICDSTNGTRFGTANTQKIGFYNKTPVVQPSANADTSGATLGQLETEVNELKALLRSLGLMAT